MSKNIIVSTDDNGREKVKTCHQECQLVLEGENDGEDRISLLPDEIIVKIISLLPVRELVYTSVLSSRWRNLRTYAYNLNFDATDILHDLELGVGDRDWDLEANNYVNMVEKVMNSHQAPFVDRLRIRFDMRYGRYSNRDLTLSWIHFAIENRVKRLEIDMSGMGYKYAFQVSGFKSLVELRLASCDITGEMVECVLLNCLLLEHLSVSDSDQLLYLKVTGPSLQLKYLEITGHSLKKIEINAENLKTLKCDGWRMEMALNYAPCLVELYVRGTFALDLIKKNTLQFSSFLLRLEMLGFDLLDYVDNFKEIANSPHFPVLHNLKQLEVKARKPDDGDLSGVIHLLKVSPSLQKFSLWLSCWPSGNRKIREAELVRLDHLKVVEFHGFIGRPIDIELATYFIKNAPALEKIVIDRDTNWLHPQSAMKFRETKETISARKHAWSLAKKLRPGVTMVIQ